MNRLEKALETLKVEISRYVVTSLNNNVDVIVVGGIEVIRRYPVRDFAKVNGSWEKIDVSGRGDETILLPFKYVDLEFDINHLEKLSEMKTKKAISKEEASKFNATSKDKLINKKIYIHEKTPSTNSIALAEQFQIRHDHVIEQIFKLAEVNPSILMGIKFGIYGYESSIPNKKENPEIKDSVRTTESSVVRLNPTVTRYRTFLHISEDVYYRFINSLGTPKSKEMKVHRDIKRQEYLKGFQVLRELALNNGFKNEEIEQFINVRTHKTSELMSTIANYVKHHNNNSGLAKQLEYSKVCRIVFNVVNDMAGINATTYNGSLNRDVNVNDVQHTLESFESRVDAFMKSDKMKTLGITDILEHALNLNKGEIKKHLENKNANDLIEELN